jgi:hypothetical protein
MYASDMSNNWVSEHELCDPHGRRITTNKIAETYAKSVKLDSPVWQTGPSNFARQN